MLTPTVTEIPRPLSAVVRDTFIDTTAHAAPRAAVRPLTARMPGAAAGARHLAVAPPPDVSGGGLTRAA